MNPKHIVIDARLYGTSSGRYVRNLISNLEKVDAAHTYTVLLRPMDYSTYKPKSPRFKKTMADVAVFSWGEQTVLPRIIKSLDPDLVHYTFVQQPLLSKVPSTTTVHDLTPIHINSGLGAAGKSLFFIKQRLYKHLVRVALRKTSQVLVPSSYVKTSIKNDFAVDDTKISVTYEAADELGGATTKPEQSITKPYLLYVGRAQNHKNLDRLVDAFVSLKETSPELQLVLIGKEDASYIKLKDRVLSKAIKDVHFLGFVNDSELRWYYKNAACYVFPSLSEGFGLPGLEAMVHGCPVVSSNATCLPEIYGNAAHYFDPEDISDMAKKIGDVLTDKKLRDSLIKRGHAQVKKYSWERMAKQTLEVYNKLLKD